MPFSTALAGYGHAIFRNVLIIKYYFHKSVETQPKKVCVSTLCFITHLKSALPKIKRGRVPPVDPLTDFLRLYPDAKHRI